MSRQTTAYVIDLLEESGLRTQTPVKFQLSGGLYTEMSETGSVRSGALLARLRVFLHPRPRKDAG